ncbi:MAG: 23S rRNA (pseudouridine(1915)-N(3))-methyltransferase RlmH [Bacteroidetes bacterium 4572_77]|nr:MAG: 23S rRNA (pseudouridine(1915)-N(3))-methyltransferase RlmH [Bacteroidetes bacterium 4572_77]
MKIKMLYVGKTTDKAVILGMEKYLKRMKKYVSFSQDMVPGLKNTKNLSEKEIKQKEGKMILDKLSPHDFLILLDENGKEFNSVAFASLIEKKMLHATRSIVFLIGGAYGFSDDVYNKAQQKIALSQMTFSHQIIRLIFMEQIYRAFTIINKEPYHHE